MEIVLLIWLSAAIATAVYASNRGGSAAGGFFLGLFLSWLGFLIGLGIWKEAKKICPACAEKIIAQAKLCRYCGYKFGADKEQLTKIASTLLLVLLMCSVTYRDNNLWGQARLGEIKIRNVTKVKIQEKSVIFFSEGGGQVFFDHVYHYSCRPQADNKS